jgi:hypothetical protein
MSAYTSQRAADERVYTVLGPTALEDRLRTRGVLTSLQRTHERVPRYTFTDRQIQIAMKALEVHA